MVLSGLSGTKCNSWLGLDDTLRESEGLSGTEGLCLLIRVSQVRDLYGLPKLEGFPCRGVLKRIRVSRH